MRWASLFGPAFSVASLGNNILDAPTLEGIGYAETGEELADWLSTILLDHDAGIVAVIRAVIDESGTHAKSPVLSVAACCGTSRQWQLLAEKWHPALRDELGNVERYHAKDASPELNLYLAELIVRHMDCAYAYVISDDEYREYASHDHRSLYGSSYELGITAVYVYLNQHYETVGRPQKIAYIIEDGHANVAPVKNIFSHMTADPESRKKYSVLSVTWVGKEEPTIHPADLIAHETATRWGTKESRVLTTLRKLVTTHYFDPTAIKNMEDKLPDKRLRRALKQRERKKLKGSQ